MPEFNSDTIRYKVRMKIKKLRRRFRRWLLRKLEATEGRIDPVFSSVIVRETTPQQDIENRQMMSIAPYAILSPERLLMSRLHKLAPRVAWDVSMMYGEFTEDDRWRIKAYFFVCGELYTCALTAHTRYNVLPYALGYVRDCAGKAVIPEIEEEDNEN